MSIPFSGLFKKAKARLTKQHVPAGVAVAAKPLPEKSAADRLSKTVMPNATRTVSSGDPFHSGAGQGRSRELPMSLAAANEVAGDRSITLTLADVLENLPQDSIKSRDSIDPNRKISLKAAEAEKGMAKGQPTALLTSIYEQVPDIFQRPVSLENVSEVVLPFSKVLEQFQAFQVRADQVRDDAVPQVETPFLQVTIEDTKRFGTSLPTLQTSAQPPVKVEPATARSIAKAEPEPVAQEKQTPNVTRYRAIPQPPKKASVPGPEDSAAPARIPFKLPPNGAGEPASERVPASSGPPVPTPPDVPPAESKPAAPVRIPFKMTPPTEELKPKLTLVPGVDPVKREVSPVTSQPADPVKPEGPVIRLRLNVCLRNLPAFQLSGSLPEIADDVMVELPYSLVESQLASGRVAIEPKVFRDAIPEKFRDSFVVDTAETPVLLPLQEVLQHLPDAALKMRQDQEQEEAIDQFETPFSFHAKQDKERLSGTTVPAQSDKPVEAENKAPAAEKAPVEVQNKAAKAKTGKQKPASKPPAAAPEPKAADPSEAKNNAKEFVLRASCLPGILGCSISFADGLTMAGNLPSGVSAEGICAVAPSVLQKIEKHMHETNLGPLTSMTLRCVKSPLTFFMVGNVCLTALHSDRDLEPVTHDQLAEMTKELAQIFAQPETTHVDH
jgi:predicted regulator of Ras-like GTPase activity (Roadblock/LC7/MglB family)